MGSQSLATRLSDPLQREDALREVDRLNAAGSEVDASVREQLVSMTKSPLVVDNTHLLASVLVDADVWEALPVLVEAVTAAKVGDAFLADYVYALGSLLDEHDAPDAVRDAAFIEKMDDGCSQRMGASCPGRQESSCPTSASPPAFR